LNLAALKFLPGISLSLPVVYYKTNTVPKKTNPPSGLKPLGG